MSETKPAYSPKTAPNVEAKSTAKQIRRLLCEAHESAIDDDWEAVSEAAQTIKTLADHCQRIEKSY